MPLKHALATILLMVWSSISLAADSAVVTPRPALPLWDAGQLTQACHTGLAQLKQQMTALAQSPLETADADDIFMAWNTLQITQQDIEGPVYLLNNVSPDSKLREAAETCLLEYNRFEAGLFQNAAIYQRIRAISPHDAVETKLQKDLLEAFEDTGVALPAAKQVQMQRIIERLELIRQEYARNIRDNKTRLTFTPEDVHGLPKDYLERAKRDEQGDYLLGFEYPEYVPFMENAANEAARRRYQIAFTNRGGPRNIELLDEVTTLRRTMAGLFGHPSYADFVTRRRMIGTPAVVHKFLGEVMSTVREIETRELEELRVLKAAMLKQPLAKVELQRWDVAYYQERLKQQRYQVDQEALRRYFPTQAAVAWVLHVSGQLYGIEFRPAAVTLWHPDVAYYDVIDRDSNTLLGGIYLDLYPREGKYGHAAVFGVRGASRLAKPAARTPISVLVANFNRQGLDFNEMETLTHEFGHLMHGVLSRTRYLGQAGTSVETDFVEAPSQMYEEWARRLDSLSLISRFCTNCPADDAPLMQRLKAARNFGRGIRYARQHLYASFDMALHAPQPVAAMPLWQQMEGATPLGHVPDTAFPGQFSHLIGHYGAGYYGYMWSEVLALDMLSQYGEKLMNPAIGQRFRHEILERGSEKSGAELVRAFLGRAPSPEAFFAEIRGERR